VSHGSKKLVPQIRRRQQKAIKGRLQKGRPFLF
jgi:hypothetical protein